MPGLREQRDRLVRLRDDARNRRKAIVDRAEREGRANLTADETTAHRALTEDITALDELVGEAVAECRRAGYDDDAAVRVRQASAVADLNGGSGSWEARAAAAVKRLGGEDSVSQTRAMTSGSVDVPQLLPVGVTPKARPVRLVDLLVNRIQLQGNAFEYFVQSVRTNNADVVPDNATKPTSVNTIEARADRSRVIAHLSEPTPQRLLMDVPGLEAWLWSEMAEGVMDALEAEVIDRRGHRRGGDAAAAVTDGDGEPVGTDERQEAGQQPGETRRRVGESAGSIAGDPAEPGTVGGVAEFVAVRVFAGHGDVGDPGQPVGAVHRGRDRGGGVRHIRCCDVVLGFLGAPAGRGHHGRDGLGLSGQRVGRFILDVRNLVEVLFIGRVVGIFGIVGSFVRRLRRLLRGLIAGVTLGGLSDGIAGVRC